MNTVPLVSNFLFLCYILLLIPPILSTSIWKYPVFYLPLDGTLLCFCSWEYWGLCCHHKHQWNRRKIESWKLCFTQSWQSCEGSGLRLEKNCIFKTMDTGRAARKGSWSTSCSFPSSVSASVSLELLQDHWIWGQGAVQKRTAHYSVHMLSCEQRLCVNSFLQHGAQMCPYSMDCSSSLILPSYSVTWICLHVFLFCCSHQNHNLGSMFLWSYTEVIWWGRSQRRLLTLPLFSKGLCFWFYWANGSQCPSKPLTDPPHPPPTPRPPTNTSQPAPLSPSYCPRKRHLSS